VTAFVALLRGVNLGGSTTLPMADLKRMCEDAGFTKVRTYIASGNVLFESDASESEIKAVLQDKLQQNTGRRISVFVRTAEELAAVAAANPFSDKPARFTVAIFLDGPPPSDLAESAKGRKDEEILAGKREVYVHYPDGQGPSKLALPAIGDGSARNMNTVAKLAVLAAGL
jgi:uncharacterized protein (DUF1697 family)